MTSKNKRKIEIDISEMFYLHLKMSKSGHQEMRAPIMLGFKAKGIHTAPPGNSYNKLNKQGV